MFDDLLKQFQGRKTYLAALGLVGLAAYQFSLGLYPSAMQSALAALAAVGLRDALGRIIPPPPQQPPARPPDRPVP